MNALRTAGNPPAAAWQTGTQAVCSCIVCVWRERPHLPLMARVKLGRIRPMGRDIARVIDRHRARRRPPRASTLGGSAVRHRPRRWMTSRCVTGWIGENARRAAVRRGQWSLGAHQLRRPYQADLAWDDLGGRLEDDQTGFLIVLKGHFRRSWARSLMSGDPCVTAGAVQR